MSKAWEINMAKSKGLESLVRKDPPSIQEITLADWFATFAMQTLINETGLVLDEFAETAYDIAEKMLEERSRRWTTSTTGQTT